MTTPSDIVIRYDGTDITSSVIYSSANFEQNANAMPGQFSFRVKDSDRSRSFTIGKEITLTLDGHKLFGGIILSIRRFYAFSAVDTSTLADVDTRQFEIAGADYNIWFDKLILRNTSDYKTAIKFGGPMWDGALIRNQLGTYFDLPTGMDMVSEVDNVAEIGLKGHFALPTQGSTWRQVMDDLRMRSGATYYIDADKKLHWHAVAKTKHSWGLTDRPGAAGLIGCRDVSATQDGSNMVTDALVWTGNEIFAEEDSSTPEGSGLFFHRFPNPPANDEYVDSIRVWTEEQEQRGIDRQAQWGRWQASEQHFGEGNSPELGGLRARYMVLGPSGSIYGVEGGLGQPLWNIVATWFGHDVPGLNHIPAGYLVDIVLYVMGTDIEHPLVQLLPLRHCSITFPIIPEDSTGTQTYVQFTGQFGTDYSDHRKLWKALRRGRTKTLDSLASGLPSSYTDAQQDADQPVGYGAYAKVTAEIYTYAGSGTPPHPYSEGWVGTGYIAGTTRVWLNGLLQRPGIEYVEIDPADGTIRFYDALLPTDQIFVEFRAAGSI